MAGVLVEGLDSGGLRRLAKLLGVPIGLHLGQCWPRLAQLQVDRFDFARDGRRLHDRRSRPERAHLHAVLERTFGLVHVGGVAGDGDDRCEARLARQRRAEQLRQGRLAIRHVGGMHRERTRALAEGREGRIDGDGLLCRDALRARLEDAL